MPRRRQQPQPVHGIKQTDFLTGELKRMQRVIEKLKAVIANRHQIILAMQDQAAMQSQVLSTLVHAHFPDGVTFTEEQRVAAGDHNLWRTKLEPGENGECTVTLVEITEEEAPKIEELKKAHAKRQAECKSDLERGLEELGQ